MLAYSSVIWFTLFLFVPSPAIVDGLLWSLSDRVRTRRFPLLWISPSFRFICLHPGTDVCHLSSTPPLPSLQPWIGHGLIFLRFLSQWALLLKESERTPPFHLCHPGFSKPLFPAAPRKWLTVAASLVHLWLSPPPAETWLSSFSLPRLLPQRFPAVS